MARGKDTDYARGIQSIKQEMYVRLGEGCRLLCFVLWKLDDLMRLG